MHISTIALTATTLLLAGTAALGQTAPPPLNLQVPPAVAPAAAASVAPRPAVDRFGNPVSPPGVYYGDTSGRTYSTAARQAPPCDDAAYGRTQTHGSVSVGVMGGNHVSGNYQTSTFSVTKNTGDCEHPTGSVGITISVGQTRFGGRGR